MRGCELVMMAAEIVINILGMTRHPEGGWYVETWRDPVEVAGGRSAGTAIYYLLEKGECSHWHRVDAAEIWHFHSGAPLKLGVSENDQVAWHILGSDLAVGERPQAVVPAHAWQSAESLGEWSLVGCTVSPGFEFSGFELAPPDFDPTA